MDPLPRTRKLTKVVVHPFARCLLIPMLVYHTFIYVYIGIRIGKPAFFTSVVYGYNYGAVCVAYWVLCRQHQKASSVTDASNIVPNEVFSDLTVPLCHCWHPWCVCGSVSLLLQEKAMQYLEPGSKPYHEYVRYCKWWENRMIWIFGIWMGAATVNIVLTALPGSVSALPPGFDSVSLAFYGYYNLSGQYVACLLLVPTGVTMLTAFYQLRFILINFTARIRSTYLLDTSEPDEVLTKSVHARYLEIQKLSLTLSSLWSAPIVTILFFCTQVAIATLVVIHYTLLTCRQEHDCSSLLYPIIWLCVSLGVAGVILKNIAQINLIAQTFRKIFVYANGCDNLQNYRKIGGRTAWLEYLETNPLEFSVSGLVINPSLFVNLGGTIVTAIVSYLISVFLGGEQE